MGMLNAGTSPAAVSLEQILAAYDYLVSRFGYAPVIQPGRIEILGWDLEYVCGPALANFIDQIMVRRLNDFVPDSDHPVILDCGANIGFSVLNYKRQFPKAKIVAFEPDPQFTPVLRRNLARNGAADVEVVEAAAWIREGEAKWLCEGIDGSKIIDSNQEDPGTTRVRTVDLADYLADPVDLLKLDIEGAEYQVVTHLGNRLHTVKNVVIECHLDQSNIIRFGKMLEALVAAGFKVSVNSFGLWRDLVRQSPVAQHHWEQYLLVAAWRNVIPESASTDEFLPYAGARSALELQTLRAEAQHLRQARDAAESDLDALRARASENEGRAPDCSQVLQGYLMIGRHALGVRHLKAPFRNDGVLCWVTTIPDLESGADDESDPTRSSLLLFEDENMLGPPHTPHDDIRVKGGGGYSHWQANLYFSSSDGSDPNANARKYTIVFVEVATEGLLDAGAGQIFASQAAVEAQKVSLSRRETELADRQARLDQREAGLNAGRAQLAQREEALDGQLSKYNSLLLVRAGVFLRRIFKT
ncbi:MAG: FkbM family methyltransferase [Acidobacteriia bacterium]|nr:FkbM family methyltransferase [Terriglobia bacterium]